MTQGRRNRPVEAPGYTPPQTEVSAQRPCAICMMTSPCDVKSLAVITRTPPVELKTSRKMRGDRVPAFLARSHSPVSDFATYDLVVHCVASYPGGDTPNARGEAANDRNLVDIEGKVEWDPTCSNGLKHQLEMVPLNHDEPGLPKLDPARVELKGVMAEAVAMRFATGGANLLGQMFGLLFAVVGAVMGERVEKSFRLRAVSCGVRPSHRPGLSSSPNGELAAIVYVYRKLSVSIKFTAPARTERKHERGSTAGANRNGPLVEYDSRSQTRRIDGGGSTTSEIRASTRDPSRYPAGSSPTSPSPLLDVVAAPHLDRSQPSITTTEGASLRDDFKLEIKINEATLDASDKLREVMKIVRQIEDAAACFADYIKKAPQIGWKLSWSVEVLSGNFEAKCERRESNGIVEGRLLPAPMQVILTGEVSVFKATFDLSFGLDLSGWFIEMTAKVMLKITGEAKGKWEVNVSGVTDTSIPSKAEIIGELTGELSATVMVTVRAVGSAELTATAATGISITGSVYDSARGGFKPSVVGKLKRGYGSVVASAGAATGATYSGEFWPERTLFDTGATQ